jgi:hypothetical protein
MTSLQEALVPVLERVFAEAGVAIHKKQKTTRFAPDEGDEPAAPEASVVYSFTLAEGDYELWLYPDEVGISEPDDEWSSLALADFDAEGELVTAVLQVVGEILA